MMRRGGASDGGTELLVIGDTLYSCDADGRWYTLVALSKQLDVWFAEFDRVTIAAHVADGAPPPDHRRLEHQNIEFVRLRRAGGPGLRNKVRVVGCLLSWIWVLVPRMRRATAVHLRAPCNVTLAAIPLARMLCERRYAIYADNWEPLGVEPATYRAQRWMLRHFGGVVHVYAPPEGMLASNLRPNVSPSFSEAELDDLELRVQHRIEQIRRSPATERALRVCCVGSLSDRKNQINLVRAAAILRDRGVPIEVRLAGTGPARLAIEQLVDDLAMADHVELLGQVGADAVVDLYDWADVNALVSRAEGYGKVFLEGMAVGCPAVCGTGAMQRSLVGDDERGRQADPSDPNDIADALRSLRDLTPSAQLDMIVACRRFVRTHTTEAFASDVSDIVRGVWTLSEGHE